MSDDDRLQESDMAVRHFVYQHFVLEARPPSVAETAQVFAIQEAEAKAAYKRLNQNHFFFLNPGTTNIRMANPFSKVPTQFLVQVGQTSYWANCAWDMLGIPAALGKDATISAEYEDTRETAIIEVINGRVHHHGGLVHFPLPARQWYDDLILT